MSKTKYKLVFRDLILKVSDCQPYLCKPFYYYKYKLKEMYNNDQILLENIDQLEKILESLGYLKFDDYSQAKIRYLKSLHFKQFKDIHVKNKRVTFEKPLNTVFYYIASIDDDNNSFCTVDMINLN